MKKIKNIIFDLGGVFIDVNYMRTKEVFENMGILNFDDYFMQHHSNPLFSDLEKGLISPEVFFDAFRKETQSNLSNKDITVAWNAMLGDYFQEAVEWLFSIKEKYNVFLFSNTNEIHYKAFIPKFFKHYNMLLDDVFIKAYYSHILKLRKPTPESFQAIIDEQGLVPAETLFIDDTEVNIKGAEHVGLQTIFLKKHVKVNEVGL